MNRHPASLRPAWRRRFLVLLLAGLATAATTGCGSKGDLVRPEAKSASSSEPS